jgi:hypothetical protein
MRKELDQRLCRQVDPSATPVGATGRWPLPQRDSSGGEVAERTDAPCKAQGQLSAGLTIGGEPLYPGNIERHDAAVSTRVETGIAQRRGLG